MTQYKKRAIKSVYERFLGKFTKSDGCWEWTAAKDEHGYGIINNGKGVQVRGHRVSHEHFKGPIPKGLVIMHLCQNPGCVNPDHLKAATQQENISYDSASWPIAERCIYGHPKKFTSGGNRYCPTCVVERQRQYRRNNPEVVYKARHKRWLEVEKPRRGNECLTLPRS